MSERANHQDAERHFINLCIECAYACDFATLEAALRWFPEERAVVLGRMLADRLAVHARITRRWAVFASTLHFIPRSGGHEAGLWARREASTWSASPPITSPGSPSRRLARLALRLLRAGAPSPAVLRQLDAANATLDAPVSAARIGEIALWAAKNAGSANGRR